MVAATALCSGDWSAWGACGDESARGAFRCECFPARHSRHVGHPKPHLPREPRQVVAREPIDGPVGHRSRAEAAVEADSGFVPVQHGPLHAAAIARHGNAGEVTEQGTSDAATAPFRQNEQIFEIQPGAAQKGGITVRTRRQNRLADRRRERSPLPRSDWTRTATREPSPRSRPPRASAARTRPAL